MKTLLPPPPSPVQFGSVLVPTREFQSILMGLMAELLARTYHESQKKLTYTVRETIPHEDPKS